MTAEKYFFKYAWPCTEVILTDKRISQQRFDDLKYAAEHDIVPNRDVLEDTYKVAFANLKELAERMNAEKNTYENKEEDKEFGKEKNKKINYWDIEVIKRYFTPEEHNMFIESEKAFFSKFPPSVKDLCKIHTAVIDKIETIAGKKIIFVSYNSDDCNNDEKECKKKERRCINLYNLPINIGDKVIIHYAYIIEKA